MVKDGMIWVASAEDGTPVFLRSGMANRHGLVAGATGTGKTVTLKVLAESFSEMGVPVFMADVKGDIASLMAPGEPSEDMDERIGRFGLSDGSFTYQGYPVTLWDIFGEKGIPLRTTISEMGPLLLARILQLNELQSGVLNVAFRIADEGGLLLYDIKDLKALLNFIKDNGKELEAEYGRISPATVSVIQRTLVTLESQGGDRFFGEPGLNICDWFSVGEGGRGMIHILDSSSLINSGVLYSTFLLWFLSELFEILPEVGDLGKPKMVFFFDEAHLLFKDSSKTLLDKIEQVVRLIRSKGVGVYFCTQNPKDIPDGVLSQLGNKIQHGLRAYTPADQRAVKAAAESFRVNPAFKTYDTILALGTGEAVVSFLDEEGIPGVCEKVAILPPKSRFGPVSDAERDLSVKSSLLYAKYANSVDPDSAYEMLERLNAEKEAAAAQAAEELAAQKEAQAAARAAEKEALSQARAAEREAQAAARAAEKEAQRKAREEERKKEQEARQKKRAAKSVASSLAGTVGREVGKTAGSAFGSFGKTVGGNVGASLGRGILNNLFKI